MRGLLLALLCAAGAAATPEQCSPTRVLATVAGLRCERLLRPDTSAPLPRLAAACCAALQSLDDDGCLCLNSTTDAHRSEMLQRLLDASPGFCGANWRVSGCGALSASLAAVAVGNTAFGAMVDLVGATQAEDAFSAHRCLTGCAEEAAASSAADSSDAGVRSIGRSILKEHEHEGNGRSLLRSHTRNPSREKPDRVRSFFS